MLLQLITLYAFSYDADGQTVTVSQRGTPDDGGRRPENVTHLLYNETGKLTARHTLTAHTTYRWDIMGSLLEARRTPTAAGVASGIKPNTVTLKRDALGRIIHEHNGVEELTRRYDAQGNLRQRREGYRIQTYRYDALGRRLSKVVTIRGDVRETRFYGRACG